jgi:hypothetical protein
MAKWVRENKEKAKDYTLKRRILLCGESHE